jgi:hypothetical protein
MTIEAALETLKGTEEERSRELRWQMAKETYPAMLFRTFRWFTTAVELIDKFIEQYVEGWACVRVVGLNARHSKRPLPTPSQIQRARRGTAQEVPTTWSHNVV